MGADDMKARTPAPEGEASLWGCADGNGIDPRLVFRDRPTAEQVAADMNMMVRPLYASPVVPAPEGEAWRTVPVEPTEEMMRAADIAGLCERLRATYFNGGPINVRKGHLRNPDGPEAADTLERQAAEIERLREALRPFAKAAALFDTGDYVNHDACIYRPAAGEEYSLSSGHLLAARAALTGEDIAGSPSSQNTEPGLPFSDAGEP